jgi:SAM-dependent methyltransferase
MRDLPEGGREGVGGGHLTQFSSVGGQAAFPFVAIYNATKWAMEGFYEALAQEVAGLGITTTLVEPGGFRTNANNRSVDAAPALPVYAELCEHLLSGFAEPIGDPAKLAQAVIAAAGADRQYVLPILYASGLLCSPMILPSYLSTTRAAYDDVAVRYAELFRHEPERPLERALLAAFAELVRAAGGGPVADIGCGPGHLTAHLDSLGLTAFGVDLSPAMIALAREAYPGLRFDEGSMTALDIEDGALGGVNAWYSIIHMPPELLPAVFAEFHRVLAPGGHLLLAFFAGDEPEPQAFDHKVSLAYRWALDRLAELSLQAGFAEVAQLRREPYEDERFQQGHILLRRPANS